MDLSGISFLGDKNILKTRKTAFLCSRKCPAGIIMKCHDWALEQRENGNCVISGFHSRIEKDVFKILLRGTQPVIMALARGMKKRWEPEIKTALSQKRILILSPFPETAEWSTVENAKVRNRLILDLADEIQIAHAKEGGNLEKLASRFTNKRICIGFKGN